MLIALKTDGNDKKSNDSLHISLLLGGSATCPGSTATLAAIAVAGTWATDMAAASESAAAPVAAVGP